MIQLEDKLYTSTEVANVLGVSLRSVYRYLEEGKLDAEVKTATGRHRFSKKNILDFLYPSGVKEEKSVNMPTAVPMAESNSSVAKQSVAKKAVKAVEEESVEADDDIQPEEVKPAKKQKAKEVVVDDSPEVTEEVPEEKEEEPIDWLAKFREAAKKYKEEAEKSETVTESVTIEEESISSFGQEVAFEEEETPTKISKSKGTKKQYFRSNLGGLKDIAQNIDKGSRNSFLDYAFTMNAGLSLYKPIKPFSMLHSYVRETDLTFFEKLLGLTPTDEVNAQLCLLVTNDDKVFNSKEELHGLYVVAKEILLKDIQEMGDSVLISEASSILK